MSAKSSIQVCIKVRPCEPGQTSLWQVKDERAIHLIDSQADPCILDHVFDQDANNHKVFDRMAKHIVQSCMQGFNGTIFAYGQTSSGKTYTMMGDNRNPGVMVLAAKEIFKQIAKNNDRDFLLRVGYIEIYNEKIFDLLCKKNQDLKIHEAANGVVNVNCEEQIITCEDDLLQFLSMGNKERTVGETNMNERSSRSHAIFRIIIESRKTDRSEEDAVIQSVLNLVDLAGSERADQTGATGARLKEGAHINKSLLFLSNVINSLAENEDKKYISFRDSKLTRILQASLVGNAFTSIICTIKPSIYDESQSTLNFAMRAKKVRIKPQVNEMVSDATMMKRLEREIKELKGRLAEAERKNESQIQVNQLQQRIKADMLKIITSDSVNNDKRFEKRRRTWCNFTPIPETTSTSAIPRLGIKYSGLPKPSFFPTTHLSHRPDNVPKTERIFKSLDIGLSDVKDMFTSNDLGLAPSDITAIKLQGQTKIPPIALTPNALHMGNANKENIERDLLELQTFTKLEKQFDGEWEKCQELNKKLDDMTAQRDSLEAESLSHKQRCDNLQNEVAVLTLSNETANKKIEEYEAKLKQLNQRIEELEMENCSVVNLEFEYKAHKTKSQMRENDLLSVLNEKEMTINNLQKSLDELSRDVLRNSKEDQMLSMCPDLETNCERICNNCQELERLLSECKTDSKSVESINCECEKLRLEIAHTRAKLETVQTALEQATTEVAQKEEHCDRLSREVVTACEGMTLLQTKYDSLEQLWQSQQQALVDLETDYKVIQKKYAELQEAYENLGQTTSASEDQRLQIQTENERLQTEIGRLKERVEEAQRKLIEATNSEALELQFKAQTEELQSKLLKMENDFNEIQREYDCLSNELMESVQEGDALRKQCHALQEELKQHHRHIQSGDAESMKSSGVGTECSETEADLDSESLQQFARLSESVHEIELQHLSGHSRIYRAIKVEKSSKVPALKLCFECTQETDLVAHQFGENVDVEAAPGVYLTGILKQHRFQISRLGNNLMEDERHLHNHIAQLENEIAEKNSLIDATERTINDMREQMTILESALLEKSVIVNKVEHYQRQIESLEKQNAEMTIVCEELQVKVKENTLSESFPVSFIDETNNFDSNPPEQNLSEIISQQLQTQIEGHQKQIALRDETIKQLQSEIQDLNERCLSMDVLQVELRSTIDQKQQLLDRQMDKSVNDAQRIDQLQLLNADLVERCTKTEKSLMEMKEPIKKSELDDSNYMQRDEYQVEIKKLQADLKVAQDDLENMEKRKNAEINELKLEFLNKIEISESDYRSNLRKYNIEWEENKDQYESNLTQLKESLSSAEEKLKSVSAQQQINLKALNELKLKLDQTIQEKNELESLYDESQKIVENLKGQHDAKSEDQVNGTKQHELIATLSKSIKDVEDKESEQLLEYEKLNDMYHNSLDKLRLEKQALQSDFDAAKTETQMLTNLVVQKSEALKYLELEMENFIKEKEEIIKKSLHLEKELAVAIGEKAHENAEMEQIKETFTSKMKDLQDELDHAKQQKQELETAIKEKDVSLEKSLQLEQKLDVVIREKADEKNEMENKIENLNGKLKELQDELGQAMQWEQELKTAIRQKDVALEKSLQLEQKLEVAIREKADEKSEMEKNIQNLNGKLNDLQDELGQAKQELETAIRQKDAALEKSLQLEQKLEVAIREKADEKSEMEKKIQNLNGKLKDLQDELGQAMQWKQELETAIRQKDAALEKSSQLEQKLEVAIREKADEESEMEKKIDSFNGKLKDLQDELRQSKQMEQKLETAIRDKDAALKQCILLQQKLDAATCTYNNTKAEIEEKTETFEAKLNDLKDELCQAREKVLAFDDLVKEHEQLKSYVSELTESKQRLEEKAESLTNNLSQAQRNIEVSNAKITQLRSELECANRAKKVASEGEILLSNQLEKLEAKMSNEGRQLQRQVEELQVAINELQIKLSSMHSRKLELEKNNKELANLLEEQRKTGSSLNDDNFKLKALNDQLVNELKDANNSATELKCRLTVKTEEINGKCMELSKELLISQKTVKELTHECEKLRCMIKTKSANLKADDQQKDATICSLLADKRDLEEKLCTVNEIVEKLETELNAYQRNKANGSNVSVDSNSSIKSPNSNTSSGLASGKRSLDRNNSLPRKSINFESEVRNRRISAHDERRQSYWAKFKDAECMTDHLDNRDNSELLERQLKQCQRDLFIRESQVTALNIELKNHPLKIENAQLKQKLQEELEKARHEVKRFKQKNQDLISKVNSLTASAKSDKRDNACSASPKPKVDCKETQTESDLEANLKKANAKLTDALNLCRSRYKQIKDLEEKLQHNENSDTSNISSLTAGQIGTLKAQCESQKKEFMVLHDKYEMAKRALQLRKEETIELQTRLSRYEESMK